MSSSGKLRWRVAVDRGTMADDGRGGQSRTWVELFTAWAEFRYQRGSEAVERGGLTGTASFKVRLLASVWSRSITTDHRLRDLRQGIAYNIREVDAVTDPANVWLVVEHGVAV